MNNDLKWRVETYKRNDSEMIPPRMQRKQECGVQTPKHIVSYEHGR